MKLVMAVISNKDVSKVLDAITKEGFSSSRISTTGQVYNKRKDPGTAR